MKGIVVAPKNVNPKVTSFVCPRGIGLGVFVTFRDAFLKRKEEILRTLRRVGSIDKVAHVYQKLGDVTWIQSNYAQYCVKRFNKERVPQALHEIFSQIEEEIKRTEPQDFVPERGEAIKLFAIHLTSRFTPTTESNAALTLYDIVDTDSGLIFFEVAVDRANLTQHKLLEQFKRATDEEEVRALKIVTWRGKRGAWVTTKTGQKVFIEEEKIRQYRNWTDSLIRAGELLSLVSLADFGLYAASDMTWMTFRKMAKRAAAAGKGRRASVYLRIARLLETIRIRAFEFNVLTLMAGVGSLAVGLLGRYFATRRRRRR